MGTVRKAATAFSSAAALVGAGCGSQSLTTSTVGAAAGAKNSAKVSVATRRGSTAPGRRYLITRERKLERDNEGPKDPVRGHSPIWSYRVHLTGIRMGPAAPSGSVLALVTLRANEICWRFTGLPRRVVSTTAFGRVRAALQPTGATIQVGPRGKSGPVAVVLGARFAPRGCIVVRPVVVNSIAAAPRLYHLSLATARDPRGALRAQL